MSEAIQPKIYKPPQGTVKLDHVIETSYPPERTIMRLPEIHPSKLDAEQRPFHDEMVGLLDSKFSGFTLTRPDGALVGPMNVLLHFPQFGRPTWNYFKAVVNGATLPKAVREVVILVTGTKLMSRYELYAHEATAAQKGLTPEQIATIVAGERPSDLTKDQALAYDLASALLRGGSVAKATYRAGLETFGETGLAELTFLVGGYAVVAFACNMFDVPVPDSEAEAN